MEGIAELLPEMSGRRNLVAGAQICRQAFILDGSIKYPYSFVSEDCRCLRSDRGISVVRTLARAWPYC